MENIAYIQMLGVISAFSYILFSSFKALTHYTGEERISLSIYVYIHTCIHIDIYRRERERERARARAW